MSRPRTAPLPRLARLLLACAAVLASLPHAPARPQDGGLSAAFERARSEGKRLVLGVYTAGEARAEDFAKRTLRDKSVKGALDASVFVQVLVGSPTKADAKRFGALTPDDHRALEREVLDRLPVNAEGVLATPQHVWFGPDGALLVAAPYELEPEEFLWLDARAAQLAATPVADPAGAPGAPAADAAPPAPLPAGARAPRRYLAGQAFRPLDGDRLGRGLLPDEEKADLELLRKRSQGGGRGGGGRGGLGGAGGGGGFGGGFSREAIEAFGRLAFTDTEDAQSEVKSELGNVFLRLGGGSNALLDGGIEALAYAAPKRGVPTLVSFLGDTVPGLRARAAAALESLGYAGLGWKELSKQLGKEDDAVVRRALLRAAGAVGRGEAAARRLLEREALEAKAREDRIAALIGLGHFGDGAATEATLRTALAARDVDVALAAGAAMALTRDAGRFRAPLRERAAELSEEAPAFAALGEVLEGAPLVRLRELLTRLAPDEFPRARLFFEPLPPALARGGMREGGR